MKEDNTIIVALALLIIGAIFCSALIVTFSATVDKYDGEINEEHEIYDDLSTIAKIEYVSSSSSTETFTKIDWETLNSINGDVCGWLTIPDTEIDYPVVYSKRSSYLYYDFEGNRNKNGTLFVYAGDGIDEKNNLNAYQNITIYGHHFKSRNTMFTALLNYKNEDFYEEHRQIIFYNPYSGCSCYTVIAAFNAYAINNIQYTQADFDNFSSLIDTVSERNLIDNDLSDEKAFENRYITLSTCDDTYNGKYGRFVVLARFEEEM